MTNQTRTDDGEGRTRAPGRRTVLRTGGAVVASMAGLAVTETALAGVAGAAPGDPVVMGATNDAGTTTTSLTSARTDGPTLALGHTGGLAPVRVVEQAVPTTEPALASGDLANYGGDLYYAAGGDGGPFVGFVYTEWTANQLVPITPQRILDTRSAAGRANIVNAAGNLDSAGRLLRLHTIRVDLSGVEVAAAAAYCNVTVVGPLAAGFLVLWPAGTRPATSSVNFAANATVANFAVTGVGPDDTVSIYTSATTHVLLDLMAFAVGSPVQLNPDILPTAASSAERFAVRAREGTMPGWASRR